MSLIVDAQHTLHRLSQLTAGFGNSFLPHRDDDGQASLKWKNGQLWSEKVEGIQIGLDYISGKIIIKDNKIIKEVSSRDKTLKMLYFEIKDLLGNYFELQNDYRLEFNYELDFDLWDGSTIIIPMENIIQLLIQWRNIAQVVLERLKEMGESKADIRVWPHHFDTGKLITKGKDFKEGYGLGYAISDRLSPSPYYYVYEWPKKNIDYSKFTSRIRGVKWVDKKHWKGAILPVSGDISEKRVKDFYLESLEKLAGNRKGIFI